MDPQTMTFGCEIECCIPTGALGAAGWPVGGHYNPRGIPDFPGWRAGGDGSIRPDAGYTAVEVVSPVLRGAEGLAQVARMAERIRSMGGKVNTSCGFHVHIGFDKAEVKALVRLIYLVANVEVGLLASTGARSRLGNRYCRSVKTEYLGAGKGTSATVEDLQGKVSAIGDRYHTLNISNLLDGYSRKPTVEFRVFAGTLNGTKMRGYIQIALGLVQYALEQTHRAKWNGKHKFAGGQGEAEVKRLFALLGWRKTYRGRAVRGVLDASDQNAIMRLLIKMGRKFDGVEPTVRPRQAAVVE